MKVQVGVAMFMVAIGGRAFAHHTAANLYDVQNRVELMGTVTSVEWKNPHVIVHVDGKTTQGSLASWTLEARAVYIMKRQGFTEDFLKVGDTAKLTVCKAKDGSPTGGLEAINYPDGTKFVGMCVIPTS